MTAPICTYHAAATYYWLRFTAVVCCLIAGGNISLESQALISNAETGKPLLQHYTSRDYDASSQNWAILQDRRGVLYVGNNECLLEYDGGTWRKITGTRGGVFSLASGARGRIYVGGVSDFGYLSPSPSGELEYVSLLDRLPLNAKEIGIIRSIQVMGDTVLYQSREFLLRLSGSRLEYFPVRNAALRGFAVNGRYYVRQENEGLCVLDADSLAPLPGTEMLGNATLSFLLPQAGGSLLVGTRNRGLWRYDEERAMLLQPKRYEALNRKLADLGLYHGLQLSDGRLALATLSGGILLIGPDGQVERQINLLNGLADNTVHFLYEDAQQGLWMAMNKGLDRLSLKAPFSYWDATLGLDASVMSLQHHRGTLYAGTSLGLYALRRRDDGLSQFDHIGDLRDQVFDLETFFLPDTNTQLLLLATGSGIYQFSGPGSSILPLHEASLGAVYTLYPSRRSPGRIYVGADRGLYVLEYRSGNWRILPRLSGFTGQVRSVAETENGDLWLGTRNRGFLHLQGVNQNTPRLIRYDSLLGQPALGTHRIYQLGEQLVFRSSEIGMFVFDDAGDTLRPLELQGDTYGPREKFWVTEVGNQSDVWVWAAKPDGLRLEWLQRQADNRYRRIFRPFQWLPEQIGLFQGDIYLERDSVAWLGGNQGLFRFDGRAAPNIRYYSRPYSVIIRTVKYGIDSLLYNGYPIAGKTAPELPYQKNALSFAFGAPFLERPEATTYSYLLEGYDQRWSPWSGRTEKEYTNLPAGDYTMRVRARNIFGKEEESTGYRFTILPPWYQTWWAYGLYLLLMGALIWGIVRLITRNQAQRLAREQQINERLRQADKMKDQFLANTSHELRTPLNGIIGLSESLLEGIDKFPAEKQQEELSLIIASGKRLSGLVNDLLDFSRLKEGDLQLRPKPVDLRSLTGIVLQISRPLAEEKSLDLQNRIPDDLPAAFVDEDRVQQVLLNLVGNAIKFTETGYVRIGARITPNSPEKIIADHTVEKNRSIEVFVRDTGIGIPAEKQEAIFQAFEQADGSIERQYGGTGLGLAISKQLIELHGGRIWLASDTGQGTTFYFSLPLSAAPATAPAMQQSRLAHLTPIESTSSPTAKKAQPRIADASRARVLIVDDEPINHHVLRNHLSDDRFEIVSAMSGEEALGLIAPPAPPEGGENDTASPPSGGAFDLVLLDIMMPRINGYEVCRRIRKKYLPSELPVIMITAKNQVPDLVEGFAVGANDYLAKPFSRDELLARVKTQLDLHQIFDITGRFVPNEFLRSLGRERLTEVMLGDYIQREVTILFTDIRNYTTLSESMTPEQNFRFVNAYHRRMGPVIRRHHGFVNQYLGDAIMAVFPKNPQDAIQAAIEMQETLRRYNQKRIAEKRQPIKVGMGLHTGPLIMGIIGDHLRMDAATIADTVNTASRIESLTKYYGASILLSEDAIREITEREEGKKDAQRPSSLYPIASTLLPLSSSLRYLGKVLVKGKQEPLGLYECFAGDDTEVAAKKQKSLSDFDDALRQYIARDFHNAILILKQIVANNPSDAVARRFLAKAEYYLDRGVPKDWEGVEVMERK